MTLGNRVAVLEEGKLHQVGTPFELYTNPSSAFVAQFIGSPGMNILPAQIIKNDAGRIRVRFGNYEVPLTKRKFKRISSNNPQEILLGFRPESVHTNPLPGCFELCADVIATEFLGHETLIYFCLDGIGDSQEFIARVARGLQYADGKIPFFVSPDDLYCFNQNGRAIK